MFNRFLAIVFFTFSTLVVSSQQNNIKHYSTKNGLSSSEIAKVFQDKKGFLWIATQGGLSKFNGKAFINYTVKNELPGNNITAVCEDKQGNIWFSIVGTALVKYNGKEFIIYNKKDSINNLNIYSLFCDSKGNVWIPTDGAGIYKYDGNRFTNYTKAQGLPTENFFAVTEDNAGNIWFGTKEQGICKYNGETFEFFQSADLVKKNNIVFSLCFDSKGVLWIGNTIAGVSQFINGKIQPFYISDEIAVDYIGDIAEDKRGNIWIATSYGVVKYNDNNISYYTEDKGLSSDIIQSLCVDYEENIWIATASSGLCVLKNEALVTFTEKDGLSSNKITQIRQLSNGEYLIGTNGMGVNKFDGLKIEYLKNDKILSEDFITALYIEKNGNIWIARESNGLAILKHINSPSIISEPYQNLIRAVSGQVITFITQDYQNNIWISTMRAGVFKFDGKKVINYTSENGLPTNGILSIFPDKQGNIWFGTFQGGIVKFNGDKFSVYDKQEGLLDNTIYCISEDKNGNLFFGTSEGGLIIYDGKNFSTITTTHGLCSDFIYALVVDKENTLWVGTDRGVNKVQLNPDLSLKSIRYYGEQDGLKSTEVAQNGMMIDDKGLLWISTSGGLSLYNPQYDYINTAPPRVTLTGIKLFYQDVDWEKYADSLDRSTQLPVSLNLSYKNNHLTFNFQALTTNSVKYTYILENFDEDWSPQIISNEAVYSNIPPGNYTFKVKAVNSDGYWSNDVVSYNFSISPPFWQTWWFYIALSVIVLASIIGFINWRTARLEKEKKILEDKVEVRTTELRVAHNKLSYAYQDIKDSIQYAKQIQDAILPLHDDLKKILPDSFIYYKPRDVVSGDFYWFNLKDEATYIAAVDCTGHGVPGAFMSMIGNTLLNEIINKQKETEPASILTRLNEEVRKALKQDREMVESKDGMDLAFCSIDKSKRQLQYSGARRPLYIVRNSGELEEIKGDKMSIGGMQMEEKTIFTNHKINLEKGDTIYIFSDGYVDQFGGDKGKKFTSKKLKELLIGIKNLSMSEQYKKIHDNLFHWTGQVEQIDDILVIGIRV